MAMNVFTLNTVTRDCVAQQIDVYWFVEVSDDFELPREPRII